MPNAESGMPQAFLLRHSDLSRCHIRVSEGMERSPPTGPLLAGTEVVGAVEDASGNDWFSWSVHVNSSKSVSRLRMCQCGRLEGCGTPQTAFAAPQRPSVPALEGGVPPLEGGVPAL